jgi:hypothetical protein
VSAMTFGEVVSRFPGAKVRGRHTTARCPAHARHEVAAKPTANLAKQVRAPTDLRPLRPRPRPQCRKGAPGWRKRALAGCSRRAHLCPSPSDRIAHMTLRPPGLVLLACAAAAGGVQTFPLRGHWIADGVPMGLDFRAPGVVWELVPGAIIGAYGTYRYADGQLVIEYHQNWPDSFGVAFRGNTLVAHGASSTWTATRIAPARGGRSMIHGTWADSESNGQIRLTTFLPSGQVFEETAFPRRYAIDSGIVTVAGDSVHGEPASMAIRIQVEGADTVLAQLSGGRGVYRRPRCRTDPRFTSGTPFTSACS